MPPAARPKILARLAARRSGGAGFRCRHAARLRSRLQAGARRARSGPRGDARCRARPRCWRRSASPACRPTGSSSKDSCRRRKARAARASPSSRASRRRWCCSRAGRGWPPRSPIWPAAFGARDAAVCRELTKLHEEVRRGDLAALARDYSRNAPQPRGEIVIVVAAPRDADSPAADVDELLRQALARASVKDAVSEVAAATGRPRREVYQRALALAKDAANEAMSARADARAAAGAGGGVPRRPVGGKPRRGCSSPRAFASWRGAGAARSARSTSWRAGASCWSSSRSRRARARRRGRSGDGRSRSSASPPPRRPGSPLIRTTQSCDMRFDAMLVAPGKLPRHIPAAFEMET